MIVDYIAPGLLVVVAGNLFVTGVVVQVSGPERSRQRKALVEIAKGHHGATARRDLFAGLAVVAVGLLGVLIGLGLSHVTRGTLCTDFCASRGHATGVIDEPAKPAPPTCRCEGGQVPAAIAMSDLETDAHERMHPQP